MTVSVHNRCSQAVGSVFSNRITSKRAFGSSFFSFLLLGDRARYPFKLRGRPLVTIPIVVAVLKTGKTHSTSMNAFSPFINPVNTALRDGGRIQIIKGINSRNFSRLHIYNTVCHKRPKAACGGCLAPKTSRLQGDDKRL